MQSYVQGGSDSEPSDEYQPPPRKRGCPSKTARSRRGRGRVDPLPQDGNQADNEDVDDPQPIDQQADPGNQIPVVPVPIQGAAGPVNQGVAQVIPMASLAPPPPPRPTRHQWDEGYELTTFESLSYKRRRGTQKTKGDPIREIQQDHVRSKDRHDTWFKNPPANVPDIVEPTNLPQQGVLLKLLMGGYILKSTCLVSWKMRSSTSSSSTRIIG